LYSSPVGEGPFQVLRGAGFVTALTLALLLQRLRPHAGLRGSWQVNGGLWFTNLIVIGAACGACACTVARWAANAGIGVLNIMPAPQWLGIPAAIVTLDLVSYSWHRANHRVPFLWRFHQVHHSDPTFPASTGLRFHPGPDRDTNFGTILATWDRLFGTRADNDSATAIETGLPGLDQLTLPRVFVLPLQRMAA